jgi:hypothetical protein
VGWRSSALMNVSFWSLLLGIGVSQRREVQGGNLGSLLGVTGASR